MTTNYKVLDKFSVVFNDLDLPHLMGWHKLYTKNIIAKKIVNLVKNGELTYKGTNLKLSFRLVPCLIYKPKSAKRSN